MKRFLTLIFFCLTWFHLKAQMDSSKLVINYKNSKYQIDTLSFEDINVKLIIARPKQPDPFTESLVWLNLNLAVPRDSFINLITSETGVYFPQIQPLEDFFIIVSCGEFNGDVILIDKINNLTVIPGYYFAINNSKNILYTKSPADGDNVVSKFTLKTKKLETKFWNNMNGEPWDKSLTYYRINQTDWIK